MIYLVIEAGGHIFRGSETPGNILLSIESGGQINVGNQLIGGGEIFIEAGGQLKSPAPLTGSALIKITAGGTLSSPNGLTGTALISVLGGGGLVASNRITGNISLSIEAGGGITIPTVLTGLALIAIEAGGTLALVPDSPAAPITDEVVTWVLNTTTGGHSTYSNFGFNSFVRLGNDYYGFSNAGIFKLSGETDDGTRLDWSAKTGVSTFDTYSLKYCHDARLTMRSDGDIALREIVDEQIDRSQAIIASDERYGIHARRVKLPKGVKGTAWQFEVYGEKTNADIKELSVTPLASQRTQ